MGECRKECSGPESGCVKRGGGGGGRREKTRESDRRRIRESGVHVHCSNTLETKYFFMFFHRLCAFFNYGFIRDGLQARLRACVPIKSITSDV